MKKQPIYPDVIAEQLGMRYGALARHLHDQVGGKHGEQLDELLGAVADTLVATRRRHDNLYALAAMHVSEVELRQALETGR